MIECFNKFLIFVQATFYLTQTGFYQVLFNFIFHMKLKKLQKNNLTLNDMGDQNDQCQQNMQPFLHLFISKRDLCNINKKY